MENDSMYAGVFIAIIGLLIWAAILNSIIAGASRSKKIERELQKQTNLLAKIASAHGVTDNEIQGIINDAPVKKSKW